MGGRAREGGGRGEERDGGRKTWRGREGEGEGTERGDEGEGVRREGERG